MRFQMRQRQESHAVILEDLQKKHRLFVVATGPQHHVRIIVVIVAVAVALIVPIDAVSIVVVCHGNSSHCTARFDVLSSNVVVVCLLPRHNRKESVALIVV